uniref:Uncharacterized protein n=1 Tax=Kalanchoe fedtschenkoi TaxID=63787 RepID=A0A7N1A3Q6_KALFE
MSYLKWQRDGTSPFPLKIPYPCKSVAAKGTYITATLDHSQSLSILFPCLFLFVSIALKQSGIKKTASL